MCPTSSDAVSALALPGAMPLLDADHLLRRDEPSRLRSCPPRNEVAYYFPPRTLDPQDDWADGFSGQWYGSLLYKAREPSLSCGEREGTTYRFLYLPTWGPALVVRVDLTAGQAVLHAVELTGHAGFHLGEAACQVARPLAPGEVHHLLMALDRAQFWELPTKEEGMLGCDGTTWVVEGRSGNDYHVVDRWEPDGPFGELGEVFLTLARYRETSTGEER